MPGRSRGKKLKKDMKPLGDGRRKDERVIRYCYPELAGRYWVEPSPKRLDQEKAWSALLRY